MNKNFNPEDPLESFLYCSEEDTIRAWEKLIKDPAARLEGTRPETRDGLSLIDPDLCPEAGEWVSIACGQVSAQERENLLGHAAVCSHCAEQLRASSALFAVEISLEEEAVLGQLQESSTAGRHRLAVDLAHTAHHGSRYWTTRLTFLAGAAAAFLMIFSVTLGIWWQHRNSPERTLAGVYSRCRCYDLRLTGASYAEVNPSTRMRGGSNPMDTTTLLAVRKRIEEHLKRSPADPHWLQLEARVDLLEEKLDPAIVILDSLLSASPSDTDLLSDDAMAYFQRGTITGSASDQANALDRLRRADELAPGNTVVLFNEAIVMEDQKQWMNAVETWNRFLHIERDPQWQAEGRRRLQLLETKLQAVSKP